MKLKRKPSGGSSCSGLPIILSLNWSCNRVTCVEEHDYSFFFPTRIYHTQTAKNSQYDSSQLVPDILCTSALILCNRQEEAADLRSSFKMSGLIMVPVLARCSGHFWISGLYLHIHLKNYIMSCLIQNSIISNTSSRWSRFLLISERSMTSNCCLADPIAVTQQGLFAWCFFYKSDADAFSPQIPLSLTGLQPRWGNVCKF